jgi:hypothetical protein
MTGVEHLRLADLTERGIEPRWFTFQKYATDHTMERQGRFKESVLHMLKIKYGLSVLPLMAVLIAGPAAACDITSEPCWSNGKCNIKFKNHTGENNGDASGSPIEQSSAAQTIKVKALKENGKTAGNSFSITAGASKTMNLEKKYNKNFSRIRVSSTNGITKALSMECSDIKAVLRGNGNCNIFHGYNTEETFVLGYSCDNGEIDGPY